MILEYKNGKFINIIHKNDEKYDIIKPLINKKKEIFKKIFVENTSFYFEFGFDIDIRVGLCYDYNFSLVIMIQEMVGNKLEHIYNINHFLLYKN